MADIKKKLLVLSRIAEELNRQHVIWAVGASLLLYFKGIVQEFADIDIMISESDAEKVTKVFLGYGKQLPANPNKQYKTEFFSEFNVDGVDFDIIAGFIILHEGTEFYFPLEKDCIRDYAEINGTVIPLQSIEEWRNYYRLMGRTDKVEKIDRYLSY